MAGRVRAISHGTLERLENVMFDQYAVIGQTPRFGLVRLRLRLTQTMTCRQHTRQHTRLVRLQVYVYRSVTYVIDVSVTSIYIYIYTYADIYASIRT